MICWLKALRQWVSQEREKEPPVSSFWYLQRGVDWVFPFDFGRCVNFCFVLGIVPPHITDCLKEIQITILVFTIYVCIHVGMYMCVKKSQGDMLFVCWFSFIVLSSLISIFDLIVPSLTFWPLSSMFTFFICYQFWFWVVCLERDKKGALNWAGKQKKAVNCQSSLWQNHCRERYVIGVLERLSQKSFLVSIWEALGLLNSQFLLQTCFDCRLQEVKVFLILLNPWLTLKKPPPLKFWVEVKHTGSDTEPWILFSFG